MPPNKRKQIKEYLSNSSITLKEGDRGFDGLSSYKQHLDEGGVNKDGGRFRPTIESLKQERMSNMNKQRQGHMHLGHDAQFMAAPVSTDMATKAPTKYHVPGLAEMKSQAKNHHYSLGMRGLSSDLVIQEREKHESNLKDQLKERNKFLMYAASIKNTVRNSNFKLASFDHANKRGAQFHSPSEKVGSVTPRVE